jgi:TonB family protein
MKALAPVGLMNLSRHLSFIAISTCVLFGSGSAQAKGQTDPAKQGIAGLAAPRAFSCPAPLAMGDVSLRIVIDAAGNVSEAKALTGPESLIPAAEACARTWKYENPPPAPVTKMVALRYESKDCPASESQRGELQYSWGLRNQSNLVIAYIDGAQPPPPSYPDEERRAGIAGKMTVAVSLNADGTVKELKVVQSLSPRIDKSVSDELRSLKFKMLDGVGEMQAQNLLFQIIFHATCTVPKIINSVQ